MKDMVEQYQKSESAPTRVAIVIINWNSWKNLEPCLQNLSQLTYPDFKVVVVDNGSSDDSVDRVETSFPDVILIRNGKNLGTAGANTVGMTYAFDNGFDYGWLFNNDALCPPDTLDILVSAAQADPSAGLYSPVLYDEHDRGHIQNAGSAWDFKHFGIRHFDTLDEAAAVDRHEYWLWATAKLYSREVYEKLGGFNSQFFVYMDDMVYAWRAIRQGFRCVLVTDAKVFHCSHYQEGERKLPLHYYYFMSRNDFFFWMKATAWYRRGVFFFFYLSKIFMLAGDLKAAGQDDAAGVVIDAGWDALLGRGGSWQRDCHAPRWLSSFISRHAYVLSDTMGCRFGKIWRSLLKKLGG